MATATVAPMTSAFLVSKSQNSGKASKIVKIAIPFWILRLGRQKYSLFSGKSDVSLEDLHLDIRELERVGPMLVLDFRAPGGDRVMIWTK